MTDESYRDATAEDAKRQFVAAVSEAQAIADGTLTPPCGSGGHEDRMEAAIELARIVVAMAGERVVN